MATKIGINEIVDPSKDILDIVRNAQIAANRNITNDCDCEFYNNLMAKELTRRNCIANEIERFIKGDSDSIYLDYQPQFNLKTNKISGFEGLARMKTESLGQVSPLEFIYIAEKSNLIIELGLVLLKKACDFLGKLNKHGFVDISVAVNVSSIQILRDDFSDNIMKIIKESGIDQNVWN